MLLTVLFVFSLFAVQLLRLQAVDASPMARKALGARLAKQVVPAPRGDIVDAGGVVLATTIDRYDISVNQKAVSEYARSVGGHRKVVGVAGIAGAAGAAAQLAPLLGKTLPEMTALLTGSRGFAYVAKNVPALTWRTIKALGINGLDAELRTRRAYPTAASAASLVGFVQNDGTPGGGVEQLMNRRLKGTPGATTYQQSAAGQEIPTAAQTLTPALPGHAVRLSINSDLQWSAQNAIAQKVIETKALSGSVVVLNVKTGQLLAVANYPTFDPNTMAGAASANLDNRAFDEVFEPGSTSKVMTMSAALEEGVATPTTPVTIPPYLIRADHKVFHDSHAHGVEHLTVAGVLAKSSNLGSIKIGEQVPAATMHDYLTKFGVGQPSGVGFPGESRGLLAPVKDWNGSQRYTVLFGQGLSLTAVQAAGVFQTIANDGLRMPPRLVEGYTAADGTFSQAPAPAPVRVISPTVAKQVREMMEGVVGPEGTAAAARVAGYRVAGKTGTADRYDQAAKRYSGKTASFVGFAPADHPQIVVAVALQRPLNGYFGGSVAAPVFAQVMRYALAEYAIPPTGTKPPHLTLTVPKDSTVVNALTGSSTTEVKHPVATPPAARPGSAPRTATSPGDSAPAYRWPSYLVPAEGAIAPPGGLPRYQSSAPGSSPSPSPSSSSSPPLSPLAPGRSSLRPR
jgi:cell division protein FtsI (penicillin-binding protein 3)